MRELPPHKNGVPLLWKAINRNKQGVTLDLRKPDGKALFRSLLADRDVLIENFRPGTLDQWGITREWPQAIKPKLMILRVTGFGQTGPYRDRPGFARHFRSHERPYRMCGEEGGAPCISAIPFRMRSAACSAPSACSPALLPAEADPASRGQEIDCP